MPRGGYREGAGRKSRGLPTSKATVFLVDREKLNKLSHSFAISVNELVYRILRHPKFDEIIEDLHRQEEE